jgi:hypothetical protein
LRECGEVLTFQHPANKHGQYAVPDSERFLMELLMEHTIEINWGDIKKTTHAQRGGLWGSDAHRAKLMII